MWKTMHINSVSGFLKINKKNKNLWEIRFLIFGKIPFFWFIIHTSCAFPYSRLLFCICKFGEFVFCTDWFFFVHMVLAVFDFVLPAFCICFGFGSWSLDKCNLLFQLLLKPVLWSLICHSNFLLQFQFALSMKDQKHSAYLHILFVQNWLIRLDSCMLLQQHFKQFLRFCHNTFVKLLSVFRFLDLFSRYRTLLVLFLALASLVDDLSCFFEKDGDN